MWEDRPSNLAVTKVLAERGGGEFHGVRQIDKAPEKGGKPYRRLTLSMRQRIGIMRMMDCPGHADYVKNMITQGSADGWGDFGCICC